MTPTPRFVLRAEGGGPELVRLAAGDDFMVGRDARTRVQIGHGSIAPFHARVRCDDWGVWVTPLEGSRVVVAGEPASAERLIPLGKRVELGALPFELGVVEETSKSSVLAPVRRAVGQAATMLLSALLHFAAIWLLRHLTVAEAKDERALALQSDAILAPPEDLEPTPAPPPVDATLEPESEVDVEPLEQMPAPDPEPPSEQSTELAADFDASAAPLAIGLAARGAGSRIAGEGTLSLGDSAGLSHGFVTRLRALRGSGVDLVFVIDATSSMQPFIEGARTAAGTLVSTLATVVNDLRVGVVAYRDPGEEFETRVLPLSGDRYAILNFLWSLGAEGGGDVPEAVAAGLEAAIELEWRPRVHRVIVVIGDAPPHHADWPRLKSLIGRFVIADRIPGAVVSAIYTGRPREQASSSLEDGAVALAEIARLGRGDFLDLGGFAQVGERLLVLTLGPKHANELSTLLARVRDGPREQMVKKRVAEGDKAWLLAKLRIPPVHPGIVEALVHLADRQILWDARKLVADASSPKEAREAALFILRRCLPTAGELDLARDVTAQRAVLDRLDAQILRR